MKVIFRHRGSLGSTGYLAQPEHAAEFHRLVEALLAAGSDRASESSVARTAAGMQERRAELMKRDVRG